MPREMKVVALPNTHYPPAPDALALASHVLTRLDELPAVIGIS